MNSRDSLDLSIEPAVFRQLTPAQKDRLTDLLDGYLCKLEKGFPPPREDLLEANADLAAPLQAYFDSLDELHDMAAGFQRPTIAADEDPIPAGDERRLGDFRLLREIGRGGMGVVYEARQISLDRRVALKVLPFAAVLDSRQIARFKHEAQAAAQLNHPNIVSVFAVGVERGVHFYAMQFIDGQPLDRALSELREKYLPAARRNRENNNSSPGSERMLTNRHDDLPVSTGIAATASTVSFQRSLLTSRAEGGSQYFQAVMRLGIQAAAALHAAHESGIIHRDIKPSNLLLDGNGKLWVTDFGLARRETDPTLTRTGDLVGTFRYMSPEQALGQSALIDHRTDIYSLAATLYELLTLEPAFPGDEGPVLLRYIERNEPRPLRQLQPKIPVDLQTVVLTGMAKRREDRYATAQEFGEDLQRVLEGKPTVARPPSLLDRATRWAQRHREVVAAACLVGCLALLGLTAGLIVIESEHQKTKTTLALVEKQYGNAQDMLQVLGTRLSERLAKLPGTAQIRHDMLGRTLNYYRGLIDQAKDNPELRADLALTYSKIGTLSAQTGSSGDAINADKQAIQIYRELAAANPGMADYRRRMGVCQNNLAFALQRIGQTDEARQAFTEAIRLQEDVLGKTEDTKQCLDDLALAHSGMGLLENETGDAQSAASSIARAVSLQEQLLEKEPEDPERLRNLAAALNNLGALYAELQPAKAIETYEKAVKMQGKAKDLRPEDSAYQSDLAMTYNNLGAVQSRSGNVAQAAESYARVVDLTTELKKQSPDQKSYRRTLAVGYNNLGLAQSRLGHPDSAEVSFRHALELQETLAEQDPKNVDLQSELGSMFNNLGIAQEELKRPSYAVTAYEQAVKHQRQAVESAPEIARYRQFLSKHYFNYGRALRQTGHPGDAVRAALSRRELWPKDPQHLFSVAEELALDAKEIYAGHNGGEFSADKCGAYAVETLKQAASEGWKPPPDDHWTNAFLAIKNRADFVALTKN